MLRPVLDLQVLKWPLCQKMAFQHTLFLTRCLTVESQYFLDPFSPTLTPVEIEKYDNSFDWNQLLLTAINCTNISRPRLLIKPPMSFCPMSLLRCRKKEVRKLSERMRMKVNCLQEGWCTQIRLIWPQLAKPNEPDPKFILKQSLPKYTLTFQFQWYQ